MRYLLPLCFLALCFACTKKAFPTDAGLAAAKAAQVKLNQTYQDSTVSILTAVQREALRATGGLPFYPLNARYRVLAQLTPYAEPDRIEFPTSSGVFQPYIVYGLLTFELNGQRDSLRVYRSEKVSRMPGYADYLFLPFRDLTSGSETYGGGRYLDVRIPKNGSKELILDFNQTYHPYCAYRSGYACPIPPPENFIDQRVEAGIKMTDAVVYE